MNEADWAKHGGRHASQAMMHDLRISVSANIAGFLNRAGLTPKDLVDRLPCSESAGLEADYWAAISGKYCGIQTLVDIAVALGVRAQDLMEGRN